MQPELKRNFVISVVLHGLVFAGFFLTMAFAPTPRLDVPIMMEIVGGGGGGAELEPPPAPPKAETPQPPPAPPTKQEEPPKPIEPARIIKQQPDEFATPKEPPKPKTVKKVVEKPKEAPKKAEVPKPLAKPVTKTKPDPKPPLVKRSEFDNKNVTAKPAAKPDSRYTAGAIRDRFAKNFMKVGTYGSGPGPANGLTGAAGSEFQAYCSMLSSRLYEVWDIPGQATTSMSTVVVIRVTSDGTLTFIKILKPSSSVGMDESAIAAVNKLRKADPLPASLGSVRELTVTFQPLGA